MAQGKVDPTTISTIWHFMQRVCREMRETMERTATSVQATTLHDLAYGIWDAQAQAIAIPEGFPCRFISSSFPIRAVIKKFGGKISRAMSSSPIILFWPVQFICPTGSSSDQYFIRMISLSSPVWARMCRTTGVLSPAFISWL